jgi:hypothetical protein
MDTAVSDMRIRPFTRFGAVFATHTLTRAAPGQAFEQL